MPPKAGGKGKGGGRKKAHVLSTELPAGTVLRDYHKGEWKIGKPIGVGGFGLIYLSDKNASSAVSPNARYVVKVEPHQNGPLFCELHFYQRVAKEESIKTWMKSKKQSSLGMPRFIAHGAHEDKHGEKYRFMVMERFGTDLQKLFEKNNKCFPLKTVLNLGIKMLDVLEYIHSKEYCHADVKASNILLSFTSQNEVYLVDYGLAFRFTIDGKHRPYKIDPKWKHNGTIEFTSRDAHNGLTPSRRGDLEILGYCLLQWLCSALPWEDKLTDPVYVQKAKEKYMSDIPALMKKCFPSGYQHATGVRSFLEYVRDMEYDEAPDYARCRSLLTGRLSLPATLDFTSPSRPLSPAKTNRTPAAARGRKRASEDLSDSEENLDTNTLPSPPKKAAKAKKTPNKKATAAKRAVKSPAAGKGTPKAARGTPSAVKTPAVRKTPVAKSPLVAKLAIDARKATPTTAKVASKPAPRRKRALVDGVDASCQTSPGLRGLKRSRRQ